MKFFFVLLIFVFFVLPTTAQSPSDKLVQVQVISGDETLKYRVLGMLERELSARSGIKIYDRNETKALPEYSVTVLIESVSGIGFTMTPLLTELEACTPKEELTYSSTRYYNLVGFISLSIFPREKLSEKVEDTATWVWRAVKKPDGR